MNIIRPSYNVGGSADTGGEKSGGEFETFTVLGVLLGATAEGVRAFETVSHIHTPRARTSLAAVHRAFPWNASYGKAVYAGGEEEKSFRRTTRGVGHLVLTFHSTFHQACGSLPITCSPPT